MCHSDKDEGCILLICIFVVYAYMKCGGKMCMYEEEKKSIKKKEKKKKISHRNYKVTIIANVLYMKMKKESYVICC